MKHPAIFFDIETTDLTPVGQILNFCFTLTGDDFSVLEECKGTIKLSRLQLPRAAAVLANKIDVEDHQRTAQYTELQAMRKINEFISLCVKSFGDYNVSLIGYNSARFDLDYLRTSMIRNGIKPYHKVQSRDLLLLSRKLSVAHPQFPRLEHLESPGRISLRLESLCQAFELLQGCQTHESSDDVRLTIELAKYYTDRFGMDVRSYQPYEPREMMSRGLHPVLMRSVPQYEVASPECRVQIPYVLLDSNHRYALWINLSRYLELKAAGSATTRAVEWMKFDGHDFFTDSCEVTDNQVLKSASEALADLGKVSLENYFTETDCDIEAHIYRIDISAIDYLRRAVSENGSLKWLPCPPPDLRNLAVRWKLANAPSGTPGLEGPLRQYALYRYGGQMKVSRFSDEIYEEGVYSSHFHPTYREMRAEAEELAAAATGEDKQRMQKLLTYYSASEIYAVAGKDLEEIVRAPKGE